MAKYEIMDGVGIIPDGETTIVNMAFSYCEERRREEEREERGKFFENKNFAWWEK
ncbi:MAG: hypothetical protein IJ998_09305 [Alistipes sp.]|nr:hypothetical protein [Alistipes sp.]